MKGRFIALAALAGLSLFLMTPSGARADAVFSFNNITSSTGPSGNGLTVTLSAVGTTAIDFTFDNDLPSWDDKGPSVCAIYFYDGHLLDSGSTGALISYTGTYVDFSDQKVKPADLPGLSSLPGFESREWTQMLYSADADHPSPVWGLNPGETLTVRFDLKAGVTYDDVFSDLREDPLNPRSLVIGLHVQNMDNGNSYSFLNKTTPDAYDIVTPVPLPAAAWCGLGLFGAIGIRQARRRRRERDMQV